MLKKVFTSLLILLAFTFASHGQHFNVVWTGNGLDHENFYFTKGILNGVDLEAGDEIAVFDGIYCVAAGILTQPLNSTDFLTMKASRDDDLTTEIDGYTVGNPITYKIWDNSESMEIDSVVATYNSGSNLFVLSGTVSAELAGFLVFDITTDVNPTGRGTTTGAGTYDYNSTATLTATPATGYNFVNWTETNSGDTLATSQSFDVLVTQDSSFTANFAPQSFSISAVANPTGGGSVSGNGPYDYNTTATLTATPATGYNFVNWTETNSGDTLATSQSFDVLVTQDSSFTANFAPQSFSISAVANPTGGGSVSGNGPYDYNTTATLTATPATGYNFVNWTETNSGDTVSVVSTLNITVTGDSSFTANFVLQTYTINTSVNPTSGGTVLGSGSYNYNETAVLTANPATGYNFLNWIETNSGDIVSNSQSINVTVTSDSSFTANFVIQSFNINVAANPGIGGNVSGNGTYNYNTTATLTATPATGYDFVNWTETNSGDTVATTQSFDLTVTQDSSFTANFELQSFTISTAINPTGGGTTSGGGAYNYNEITTLVATPATSYEFVNWTVTNSGDVASGNPGFDVTVTSDSSFTANFIRTYSISISANPVNGGTISGAGTYTDGSTVNLSATANAGYVFINWTEGGSEVSTNPNYSFTASADRSLIANFTGSQTITLSSGWNIMSFYVTPPDPDLSVILASLISEGSLDKVQDETGKAFENVAGIGWINEIGNWAPTEGYKIRVNTNTQLDLTGDVISLPAGIPLETGWNIMSFPSPEMQNSQDVVAALISSGELVKVQDQTGSAIVYLDPNWQYYIINFHPGEGYKINVNTNTSITIDELPPNKSGAMQKETVIPEHFSTSWTGNGYNHMNIYILPEGSLESGDEVAAFDGNICVGIGMVDPAKDYISIITSMDDPMTKKQDGFITNHKIQLRVWQKETDKEYTIEKISFRDPDNNKYVESGTSIIQMNLEIPDHDQGWSLGDAYPNPFNDFTTIHYSVAKEMNIRIEIYNATGQKIKVLLDEVKAEGDYTITWDRTNQNGKQISSGTYFYRMITNNYSEVKTLIYMGK